MCVPIYTMEESSSIALRVYLHREGGGGEGKEEGDVRGERAVQRLPRERELLERRDRDADDDRQQRRVHLPLEDGAQHQVREDAREDRLRRLDGLGERDGASAERDDGAGVAEGVGGAKMPDDVEGDGRRARDEDLRVVEDPTRKREDEDEGATAAGHFRSFIVKPSDGLMS